MTATTDLLSRLLDDLRGAAERAGVFGEITLRDGLLACRARDAAEEAWYQVAIVGGRVIVRLVTADRWLSESIESDLMHYGDPLEELIEEELVELGHDPKRDGAMAPVKHFRSEDRLYTFESVVPLDAALASGDAALARTLASRYLLAYEAAFRELGDMAGGDDE